MLQKEVVQKVVQLTYFQTGKPMVLVQKWPFLTFLFSAIQARRMSFTIFYNEKTPFLAIKTTSSKTQKNCHFLDFYFLGNICRENVLYDILQRKNAFLGYKNNKFKILKN